MGLIFEGFRVLVSIWSTKGEKVQLLFMGTSSFTFYLLV